MKQAIFIGFILGFLALIVFAGNTTKLKINFSYRTPVQTNKFDNALHFPDKEWIVIGGLNSKNSNLTLLAQTEPQDLKTAKVNFILLKNNEVISQPSIILKNGLPGKMVIKNGDSQIDLNVTATI